VSAGIHRALNARPVHRPDRNNTPPHQGLDVSLVGPQTPTYALNYPNGQHKIKHSTGSAQPRMADVESYTQYTGQGVADVPIRHPSFTAPFDGYGASPLKISEAAGSGGAAGVFMGNESTLSPWAMSTAGEIPGHTRGMLFALSPHDQRMRKESEVGGRSVLDGLDLEVMPDLAQMLGSTAWGPQQQYDHSASATGSAVSLTSVGTRWVSWMDGYHPQTQPSVYGRPPHPHTQVWDIPAEERGVGGEFTVRHRCGLSLTSLVLK